MKSVIKKLKKETRPPLKERLFQNNGQKRPIKARSIGNEIKKAT